jgi:hypothetical protein
MTSVRTNRRAITVAATVLTITAITPPAVSARPSQRPHPLVQITRVASTPAPRARAASIPGQASHHASANPHTVPTTPVGLSTLPRTLTTAKNRRGIAIVNADKPEAPAEPSISSKQPKREHARLIVRYGTHRQPPARRRQTPTHKFTSDGNDHIPAGDLHSDPAGMQRPRPPRIGHMGTQAVRGGIDALGAALTAPAANTLSPPPAIPAPLKSGPARAAAHVTARPQRTSNDAPPHPSAR